MPVNSFHPEYTESIEIWDKCEDFSFGTRKVKAKKEKYLPRPNPDDRTPKANARYENYLKRAVFYEYSSKIINQYMGMAFKQDPICEIDENLEYLKNDANGSGVSLYQIAQKGFRALMTTARFGLWVDYDSTHIAGKVSREIAREYQAKTNIIFFDAKQIINWRVVNNKLAMVVLHEIVTEQGDDYFDNQKVEQYRELGIDETGYFVRIWRKIDGTFAIVSENHPTNGKGEYWQHIPFQIFGAQYNTFEQQDIPIEPLVHIEHGIYCNSADAENSRYLCGQIQPYTNMDAQTTGYYLQVDEQGERINRLMLGSESVLMMGENGRFGFAQAEPNTMATQGIVEKREIIAELGYQLGQSGLGVKTATQADNEAQAQHSQASLCVANINEGMMNVLMWCYDYQFLSGTPKFAIRQQFSPVAVDVNVLTALGNLVDGGKLPKSVIFAKAKEYNLLDAELTDDDIIGMIDSEFDTSGYSRAVQETSSE